MTLQDLTDIPEYNWRAPEAMHQFPKFSVGDKFQSENGAIGMVTEVNFNPDQTAPHDVSYAAHSITKDPHIGKKAWWNEREMKRVE